MAIIMAGRTFTAADLKQTAGNIASAIRDRIQDAGDLKTQLESWPDPDLIALGLTQEEINAIKGFFIGDLPGLQTPLANSLWIKQLLGLGQG